MEYAFTSSTYISPCLRACGSCRKSDHVEAVSATSTLELNSTPIPISDDGRTDDSLHAYLESHMFWVQPRFWFVVAWPIG